MSELTIMSFAYSRREPPEANLLFDMRFLRNPHWQEHLRPLSGLDAAVGTYIAGDPAFPEALSRIEGLGRLGEGWQWSRAGAERVVRHRVIRSIQQIEAVGGKVQR